MLNVYPIQLVVVSVSNQGASVATLITSHSSLHTTITAQPGAIVIRGAQGKEVSVYTLDGRRIKEWSMFLATPHSQRENDQSSITIPVSAGVYAVKVDRQTVNLTVK